MLVWANIGRKILDRGRRSYRADANPHTAQGSRVQASMAQGNGAKLSKKVQIEAIEHAYL